MLQRPVDAIPLRKNAAMKMEQLYDILKEEQKIREWLMVEQKPERECLICLYPYIVTAAEKAKKALHLYEKPVNHAIQDLKIIENPLRWFLSTEKQKNRAFASIRYLSDSMDFGFGPAHHQVTGDLYCYLKKSKKNFRAEYRENHAFYHSRLMELREQAAHMEKAEK